MAWDPLKSFPQSASNGRTSPMPATMRDLQAPAVQARGSTWGWEALFEGLLRREADPRLTKPWHPGG